MNLHRPPQNPLRASTLSIRRQCDGQGALRPLRQALPKRS